VKSSIIGHLILKDWRLNRQAISLCIGIGLVALVLAQFAGEVVRLVGAVWFFVSLCILGSMLPGLAILNERKKQTLAFVMSLPVSSVQYSIAKALSTSAMFLVPWLTLLISALVVIETRHTMPHGIIPMFLILAMLPLIAFFLISATALVAESEGWLMAVSIVCNSSYWLVWYLLARTPSLRENWTGPVAVWNPAALIVLSVEVASIVFIVGIAFFLQSRKRNFI
jgi:ABC-2 type transport system permease protein